jgi:hypothetical protein
MLRGVKTLVMMRVMRVMGVGVLRVEVFGEVRVHHVEVLGMVGREGGRGVGGDGRGFDDGHFLIGGFEDKVGVGFDGGLEDGLGDEFGRGC